MKYVGVMNLVKTFNRAMNWPQGVSIYARDKESLCVFELAGPDLTGFIVTDLAQIQF